MQAFVAGATGQTHKALVNGMYKVLATELDCSTGLFSNEVEILYAGINTQNAQRNITIYPNPSGGIINFSGTKAGDEIVIYRMDMSELKRINLVQDNQSVDCTELTAGMYFLQLRTGNSAIVKPLTIVK